MGHDHHYATSLHWTGDTGLGYRGYDRTHTIRIANKEPLIVTQAAVSKAFFDAIGGAKEADGLMTPIQLGSFGEAAGGDMARLY